MSWKATRISAGAVLGLDPAWTPHGSSGVALLAYDAHSIRFLEAAPSYRAFCAAIEGRPCPKIEGMPPDAAALLEAARARAGTAIDTVAIDMPVSRITFDARRSADRLLTKAFSSFGASTHSPNAERPGAHGRGISDAFRRLGYDVATAETATGKPGSLVEIYPHPALIRLMNAPYRLTYKAQKQYKCWRGLPLKERRERIVAIWSDIVAALATRIDGLRLPLPDCNAPLSALKQFEDTLDGVVSAWAGIAFMRSAATPYGDETAAIWVPN